MPRRETLPVNTVKLEDDEILEILNTHTKFTEAQRQTFLAEWRAKRRKTATLAKACDVTGPTIVKIKRLLLSAHDPEKWGRNSSHVQPPIGGAGETSYETSQEGPASPSDTPSRSRPQSTLRKLSQEGAQNVLDRLIDEARDVGNAREVAELMRVRASITPSWRETYDDERIDPEKILGKEGMNALGQKFVAILERLAEHRDEIPFVWNAICALVEEHGMIEPPPVSERTVTVADLQLGGEDG